MSGSPGESLRDIEICLASFGPKLYHAGIRQPISRSKLADANEKRDWRILADFAHVLIQQVATLYADEPFPADRARRLSYCHHYHAGQQ